jgi:hypothetical protein
VCFPIDIGYALPLMSEQSRLPRGAYPCSAAAAGAGPGSRPGLDTVNIGGLDTVNIGGCNIHEKMFVVSRSAFTSQKCFDYCVFPDRRSRRRRNPYCFLFLLVFFLFPSGCLAYCEGHKLPVCGALMTCFEGLREGGVLSFFLCYFLLHTY